MKKSIFLGCTVPVRALNYDMASRKVAEAFDVEFQDLPFTCCGYPLSSVHRITSVTMAAVNLAKAEQHNLDIITVCSACTTILTKVNKILKENKEEKEKINNLIEPLGYEFKGTIDVKHFMRFLAEDIGIQRIEEKVVNNLEGFKIAPIYGCHYLKPSEIYDGFDDPERPVTLDQLIEATGAAAIDFEGKNFCCGGAILGVDETTSLTMTKEILDGVKKHEADSMALLCPFCSIMFDEYQPSIGEGFHTEYNIPALFYPQLLGLAMGYDPKTLGINKNKVKAKKLVKRILGDEK
jgi:heterodisulfide reductase subunit B